MVRSGGLPIRREARGASLILRLCWRGGVEGVSTGGRGVWTVLYEATGPGGWVDVSPTTSSLTKMGRG